MRKFRGKRKDNGEWVYGSYYTRRYDPDRPEDIIIDTDGVMFIVIPETVGQSTGKTERWRQDRLVWEGDIVKFRFEYGFIGNLQQKTVRAVVVYNTNTAQYEVGGHSLEDALDKGGKVIGDIHSNPELLETDPETQ
ncbi:hypothetical protein LCGC14_0376010 [marine sediment metagenome]|uniref:YopX protein domain-containing protein n=1 Tax=marine sediment metagenome TaxID=412755 RepID=A0A0F9WCI0_9ZZZZ